MSSSEESFDVDSGAEDNVSSGGSDVDSTSKKVGGAKRTAKAASVATTTSAKILEVKLENLERSCQEYRESAKKAHIQHMALESQLRQTEKDTIDVITFLKKEDMNKEDMMEKMKVELEEVCQKWEAERGELEAQFREEVSRLRLELDTKREEADRMRRELEALREYQQGRTEMLRELDQIRQAFLDAKEQQKKTIQMMENRIVLEKSKLQQSANQKLSEVASKAYDEALQSLEANVSSTYKENTNLMQALQYHTREQSALANTITALTKEKDDLRKEINIKATIARKNLKEVEKYRAANVKLETENRELLDQLDDIRSEVRRLRAAMSDGSGDGSQNVVAELRDELANKRREIHSLRRELSALEGSSSDVHRFILDALDDVRSEKARRSSSSTRFVPPTTNDQQRQDKTQGKRSHLYWSELTPSEREAVLRILFSKLNRTRNENVNIPPGP